MSEAEAEFTWEPMTTCNDGWHIGGRVLRESRPCPTCKVDHETELAARQSYVLAVHRQLCGRFFEHHRTRDWYMLKSVSLDAATLEACVSYETATGPKTGMHWTRSAPEFFGPAVPGDPTSPPRFRLVPSRFRTP